MRIAITRPVSPTLAGCELTHIDREPIDVARATAQHAEYERLLGSLGAAVVRLEAAPECPDAVFVEDTAIVLDEIAIVTRPGAPARRAETAAVAEALAAYRPVRAMSAPATMDGGDVLRIGRTLHVGRSSRTNDAGLAQLAAWIEPLGYRVVPVTVTACLHLKSAATAIGDRTVLVNPAWVPAGAFEELDALAIDPREPYAANALRVGETLVYPSHFPRTHERLVGRGFDVAIAECGELAKAEGAVTCCSLIIEDVNPGV